MQECGQLWTTVLLMLMLCVQWAEHLWIGEGGRRMPTKQRSTRIYVDLTKIQVDLEPPDC